MAEKKKQVLNLRKFIKFMLLVFFVGVIIDNATTWAIFKYFPEEASIGEVNCQVNQIADKYGTDAILYTITIGEFLAYIIASTIGGAIFFTFFRRSGLLFLTRKQAFLISTFLILGY